jgi:hypothetical protein
MEAKSIWNRFTEFFEPRHTQSRPREFAKFWNFATTTYLYTHHDEILEVALGIGGRLDRKEISKKEAQMLMDFAKHQVRVEQVNGYDNGEERSIQLVGMIESGNYPEDLCRDAARFVKIKYPLTKI